MLKSCKPSEGNSFKQDGVSVAECILMWNWEGKGRANLVKWTCSSYHVLVEVRASWADARENKIMHILLERMHILQEVLLLRGANKECMVRKAR